MKLALKDSRSRSNTYFRMNVTAWWSASKPFVENSRAILIHRPRIVTTHKLGRDSHLGIEYYCGNVQSGTKKFTFLDAPPVGKILCQRCEENALLAGLPSASNLAGRHVCVGGLKAFSACCAPTGNTDKGESL